MSRPFVPIDIALQEAGFTLTQKEENIRTKAHTYHHPETQATCLIRFRDILDLAQLHIRIYMEHGSHLRLDLTEGVGNSTIGYLNVAGLSQLTMGKPVMIENLELHNSRLHDLSLIQEKVFHSLRLVDTHCAHSTIETSANSPNHEVILNKSRMNSAYLGPTVHTVENCYIHGLDLDQKLHLIRPVLKWSHIDLSLALDAPCDPTFILPYRPSYGTITNLNGQTIKYTLLTDQEDTRYLQLGCWLDTLDKALELINQDHTRWPSYVYYRYYDEETVRTTRQSYQHLIEMLRRAPID